jgi:GTP-binding protein
MLIDEVTIRVKAGDGGRGAVAFDKNKGAIGPTGGRGGDGGNVFLEGVSDLSALNAYRNRKDWEAGNGEHGRGQFRDGHTGKDIVLKVPIGTVVHNLTDKTDKEIIGVGERMMIAEGGHGGKGNFLFRSPRNTSPERFQEGLPGARATLLLELKYIADVGLIGLPNAGKSSMLNEITNARAKVANYPFTTLEPNLGTYGKLIIADIPGLIEGASDGRGLGDRFLRHIERTRMLFHFIPADSPNPEKDYRLIRTELGAHHPDLLKKPERVFLTKSDAVSKDELAKKLRALRVKHRNIIALSIYDPESIERMTRILDEIKKG